MRTIQLAGSLLLGAMLMVGCAENSPTELTDTPAFAKGPPDPLPGPPESHGPPGEVCIPFESLVGTWTLTSFTLDGMEVDFGGTNVEFTFMNDGTVLESVTGDTGHLVCDRPATSCTDEGSRYIQTDVNLLICDPHCDEINDYTISGTTWNFSFDGNDEDPPFTATFERT